MFSGSIGMTYEQGGSHRGGLAVITSIGDTLSLVDRVKHHVKAGISTVETSSNNAKELIHAYQIFNSVDRYKYKSFVVKGIDQRVSRLLELLDKNNIEYYKSYLFLNIFFISVNIETFEKYNKKTRFLAEF